ncbi:MAG TPA: HypC/HybG/HupF family hydrogenase formation chaperone [Planctomycetes bacterium]|nr:HypC/HybG/HupF family hydrogenase formation chaperone [Planctomycetota bacterium]
MCLAIPLKLKKVAGETGTVEVGPGAETDVNLALVPDAAPGDYVLVHAGFAIHVLDPEDAAQRLAIWDEYRSLTAT